MSEVYLTDLDRLAIQTESRDGGNYTSKSYRCCWGPEGWDQWWVINQSM